MVSMDLFNNNNYYYYNYNYNNNNNNNNNNLIIFSQSKPQGIRQLTSLTADSEATCIWPGRSKLLIDGRLPSRQATEGQTRGCDVIMNKEL